MCSTYLELKLVPIRNGHKPLLPIPQAWNGKAGQRQIITPDLRGVSLKHTQGAFSGPSAHPEEESMLRTAKEPAVGVRGAGGRLDLPGMCVSSIR